MLLTAQDRIRMLQRKLNTKVKQEAAIVRRSMVECIGVTSSVALINMGQGNRMPWREEHPLESRCVEKLHATI